MAFFLIEKSQLVAVSQTTPKIFRNIVQLMSPKIAKIQEDRSN